MPHARKYAAGALIVVLIACIAGIALPPNTATAQSGDMQTAISPHKTFAFDYPAGWELDQIEGPVLTLTNGTTWMFFHGPHNFYGSLVTYPYESPAKLITELVTDDMLADGTLTNITIGERAFARLDSVLEGYGPFTYLATLLENGDPILIGAFLLDPATDEAIPDDDIATLLTIVASLRSVREPVPATLESYTQGWQAIVAELTDKGLVPTSGGRLLFDTPDVYVDGSGLFAHILSEEAVRNVVVGADIDFQIDVGPEHYGNCVLETRADLESDEAGYQVAFVSFYVAHNGWLYVTTRENTQPPVSIFLDPATYGDTQLHLAAYLIGDRLTVYVNGKLAAHNLLVPDQAGAFLIALDTPSETARCDMHVWAYALP